MLAGDYRGSGLLWKAKAQRQQVKRDQNANAEKNKFARLSRRIHAAHLICGELRSEL